MAMGAYMEMQKSVILLGCIFSILGGFFALIYIIARRHTDLPIKFIGSFFVIALCFFANHCAIYAVGIFIIATLVTELEFLEKLAAIFWGRKEYWDYLVRKASNAEVRQKMEEEFKVESNHRAGVRILLDQNVIIKEWISLERNILEDFTSKGGFFPKHHLKKEVAFVVGSRRFVIDAIADGPNYDYLIEIKLSRNINGLKRAAEQLRNYALYYREYLEQKRRPVNIRLLIIATDFPDCPDSIEDMPILKYNMESRTFVNRDVIQRWIFE